MRDIFSELISELDTESTQSSSEASPEESTAFTLPESVRPYIPATMWSQITETESPRKGVLLNGLDRVRSILYLVSTYLPHHLVQQKMRRPICGHTQGREVTGTLLFSDVSGFTALSERLAVLGNEGAEKLTQIMNTYFEQMLEILSWSGGILLKFAGDATLVFFEEQEEAQQAAWAVRTGQRMMAAMSQFQEIETPLGTVGLKMKIGISTGRFLEAHIGSHERMEYVVIGNAVRQTMAAEGAAQAGMIIVDEQSAKALQPGTFDPLESGFFSIHIAQEEEIGSFEVKAGSRRARGSMPWNASPHAIAAQMEVAARQIECLTPFLAQELVDNIITNARRRRIASEFRPTSVIFCNFIGFEEYLEQWGRFGPRRVAMILSQFFEAMHKIINELGGVVTRIDPYSKGSKMLILFGAPVAHEDDPQRAVSAAIAMQAKVAELNKEWQQLYTRRQETDPDTAESDIQIQLKIGITHGPTFAGQVGSATRREYTVMGDDVNLSARLMSAAQPGQILINEPVFRAVEDHFYAERLDPIRVKGKTNPIPIYELKEKRAAQSYQDEQTLKPVFGRSQELERGAAAIQQALQGQGQHLQIQGTAGIGKSHLAQAFYTQAQSLSVELRLTHCHSFTAQSPYSAWIFLIRSIAGINEMENSETAGQKLAALLDRFGMSDERYTRPLSNLLGVRIQPPQKSPPPKPIRATGGGSLFSQLGQKVAAQEGERSRLDLSRLSQKQASTQSTQLWQHLKTRVASRERARLFATVFHLLQQSAARKPLVLFFENAQWLDPTSIELLEFISGKLPVQPMLILSIYREATAETGQTIESTIPLGPLAFEGTAEMVNHIIGETLEPTIIETIHNQSSGNPLFIREMVYWLERNRKDGRNQDIAAALQSSMTIQELILSRIDTLPIEARETLKSAAIIGNTFQATYLKALLQKQRKQYNLPNVFEQLETTQIIARSTQESSDEGDVSYAFQQPLMREIIYASQSFTLRRQTHNMLAHYLEEKCQDSIDQQADLLAYHFEQAQQWLKAGRYRFRAAQKARQRFAYELAANSYGQALGLFTQLALAERDSETIANMAQCHEGQGDMALLSRDMVSAAFAYRSAVNLLTANELPTSPELQIKVAQTLPILGSAAEAETLLQEIMQRPLSATNLLAATATLTWLYWRRDADETPTWLNRTQTLIQKRPTDPWAAGISALLTEWQGNLEDALEAYTTFEEKAGIILTNCRLGDRSLKDGNLDKALTHYGAALKTAEEQNDKIGLSLTQNRIAVIEKRMEKRPLSEYQPYDDAFRIFLLFNSEIPT